MKHLLALSLILFSALSTAAMTSPCGKTGMTALRANSGSGFLFFIYREKPDLYFELTGNKISFPSGTNGPRRFVIDGTMYESLLVKPADFLKSEKLGSDLDVLKKHQAYEFEYMQTTSTPLRKLVEVGPRVKAASGKQPEFTFYLWEAVDPKDQNGARQMFLTTVSEGDVVVLTAIVRDGAGENTVVQAFQTYAASFQHVLKKEDCPER